MADGQSEESHKLADYILLMEPQKLILNQLSAQGTNQPKVPKAASKKIAAECTIHYRTTYRYSSIPETRGWGGDYTLRGLNALFWEPELATKIRVKL